MKIYFPKYHSKTAEADPRWIIAFIIICFLAGVCGLYLFWRSLLAVAVLGAVGILLAAAAYALLNYRTKIDETAAVPIEERALRSTSGWDYRPTAIRRSTAFERAPVEKAEVFGPSARNETDYVWFNALESLAHTHIDASPEVSQAGDERAVIANPDIVGTIDDAAVSVYDQSPIDNQTAVAE